MRASADGALYAETVSALLAHVDSTLEAYEAREASVLLRMLCSSPTAVDIHASLIAKLVVATALGCDANQGAALQNLCISLVKLELVPPLMMPCVAERLERIPPASVAELSLEGLDCLMQMFMALRLSASADLKEAWQRRLQSHAAELLQARPATVASIVRTIGMLGADRPALFTDELSRYVERRLVQFSEADVRTMLEGLAQLGTQCSLQVLPQVFQWRPPAVLAHTAAGVRILSLCAELAHAGVSSPAEFTNGVAAAVVDNRKLSAADVSAVTCALAALPTPPTERVLLALTRRTVATIGDFRPQEILNMLAAITKLEHVWVHAQVGPVLWPWSTLLCPCSAFQWCSVVRTQARRMVQVATVLRGKSPLAIALACPALAAHAFSRHGCAQYIRVQSKRATFVRLSAAACAGRAGRFHGAQQI
jgi:hypothetical protein